MDYETTKKLSANSYLQFVTNAILRFIQSPGVLTVVAASLVLCEFSTPIFFQKLFHTVYNGKQLLSMLFILAPTFVFFFVIPLLLNVCLYKEKLTQLGLAKPYPWGQTLLLTLGVLLILAPCILWLAKQAPFQRYYSLQQATPAKLVFIFVVILPGYYFLEEFFFRGFLLATLWRKVKWHSLWITDLIFTLAHLTKPALEILLALPAGILLALLTFRTKSIFPAVVVHYLLGVTMILGVNG